MREIEKLIRRALKILKKDAAVEVYFVTDRQMKTLRGKSTNVLAYPEPKGFPHPETKKKFLGEIYLNPVYIKKRGEDMRYLAIHGLFHLLGYDHKRRTDRIKMEREEQKLLKLLCL